MEQGVRAKCIQVEVLMGAALQTEQVYTEYDMVIDPYIHLAQLCPTSLLILLVH
jgi:hypothetical protein